MMLADVADSEPSIGAHMLVSNESPATIQLTPLEQVEQVYTCTRTHFLRFCSWS